MLRNFSIKQRLLLNGLAVGVAMLVMLGLLIFQSAQQGELAELRLDIDKLKSDVLTLRRHEKDFLMRKD